MLEHVVRYISKHRCMQIQDSGQLEQHAKHMMGNNWSFQRVLVYGRMQVRTLCRANLVNEMRLSVISLFERVFTYTK